MRRRWPASISRSLWPGSLGHTGTFLLAPPFRAGLVGSLCLKALADQPEIAGVQFATDERATGLAGYGARRA